MGESRLEIRSAEEEIAIPGEICCNCASSDRLESLESVLTLTRYARRPYGQQTSYYQPIRIRKLRQRFASGEVTGIVLGFTNDLYMRRFREANARALA